MDDRERLVLDQVAAEQKRNAQVIAQMSVGYQRAWGRIERLERREIRRDARVARATEVQEQLVEAVQDLTKVTGLLATRINAHEVTEARSWGRALLIQIGQVSAILLLGAGIAISIFVPGAAEWARRAIHDITQ